MSQSVEKGARRVTVRRDGAVLVDGQVVGEAIHPRDTAGPWWVARSIDPKVGHFLGSTRRAAVASLVRYIEAH